jgi:hypothetical protein
MQTQWQEGKGQVSTFFFLEYKSTLCSLFLQNSSNVFKSHKNKSVGQNVLIMRKTQLYYKIDHMYVCMFCLNSRTPEPISKICPVLIARFLGSTIG